MSSATQVAPAPTNPNAPTVERVLEIEHYTDSLFRFQISRPSSFRFRSGEFVMIGLSQDDARPIMRAYSVASPSWDDNLEFYSIKVADGPLTSKLQKIEVGDEILLGRKPTGTLVVDALLPASRLFLFSTGTGFAPFASVIRDPETYEKYQQIIVTHTCRTAAELQYSTTLIEDLKEDPLIGEMVGDNVRLYTSCTREPHTHEGRITDLIDSGKLFEDLSVSGLDPEKDRAMICGSKEMISDTANLLEARGFTEGSNASPGKFVVEKAFAG